MGSEDRRTSYETAPSRVERGRGNSRAAVVALGIAGLLAVAVVKPWGAVPAEPVETSPAIPSASLPVAIAPDDTPWTPADIAVGPTSRAIRATTALLRAPAGHAGRWGIAGAGASDQVGSPGGGTSDAASWTAWTPVTPARATGTIDARTTCRAGPHLPPGPLVLAVTAPSSVRPDWVPDGWRVLNDGPAEFPAFERLPADAAARIGLSALIRTDGSPWPDGVYRLAVLAGHDRVSIDLCIGDGLSAAMRGSPGQDGPVVGVASGGDPLFAPLIARLSSRSGAWGIGSAGWGISPVSGSPWTGWEPVDPVSVASGASREPPSCAALEWLRAGIVVGVTVPPGLPPDWKVDATRYGPDGGVAPAMPVTQVSPAGNRGIAYLVRSDAGAWRTGAYRFTIRAGSSTVTLDSCLVAL
jgi:hypothetical protein